MSSSRNNSIAPESVVSMLYAAETFEQFKDVIYTYLISATDVYTPDKVYWSNVNSIAFNTGTESFQKAISFTDDARRFQGAPQEIGLLQDGQNCFNQHYLETLAIRTTRQGSKEAGMNLDV